MGHISIGLGRRGTYRFVPMAMIGALAAFAAASLALADDASAAKVRGQVKSGNAKLGSMPVTLYQAGTQKNGAKELAAGRTRSNGRFGLKYDKPGRSNAVLYLTVGKGGAVRLATVLGTSPFPSRLLVNERTTVAAGFALAQFLNGNKNFAGSSPGLQNAAGQFKNLVNAAKGRLGGVIKRSPNGEETSTIETFNSLANLLPRCARNDRRCSLLFDITQAPGGSKPKGTLKAIANIARNAANNAKRIFKHSLSGPAPYRPALTQAERPSSWLLALRFDGDGESIDGPGNFAIDEDGNLWVNNNYIYGADPLVPQCASDELFKFDPRGRFTDGSPFTGGGLSGAGYGITIAPDGNVWVGNFGFQGVGCTDPPPRNSVSEFTPDGTPLSPDATSTSTGGYTAGSIDAPQATVADRDGNIWIANCNGDSVTIYPGGDPSKAILADGIGVGSPFGLAINDKGQAFVAGNSTSTVGLLNPDGTPTAASPISGGGIDRPMGVATDSRGNAWVANFSVPFICETPEPPFDNNPSVTLLSSDGAPDASSPFTGGGLVAPWGITVDGDDNVWVGNFAGQRISQLCGTRTKHCPPGSETGDPISPANGYEFGGLTRLTGIAVDPSGNVWAANNWEQIPIQSNPGGHQIVAFLGAAAPLKTPVIGVPRS